MKVYKVVAWSRDGGDCLNLDDVMADGPSQAANRSVVAAFSAGKRVDYCNVVCPDGSMHTFDVDRVRISCSVKWRRP